MADELEAQVDASVTETPSESAAPIESTPDLSAGGETVTATPEVEWKGVRDYLPELGIANDQFADDEAAIRHLAEQARQYQQIQPYWNQVAPNYSKYQEWLAQQQQAQQQPAQPAQPAKKPYWEPLPELDQAALRMVAHDPATGQIVVKPEYRGVVAPDLPQKVQAYLQAKQDRESKLLNDPVGAIWGGVEERLQGIFEQREKQLAERMYQDMQARQYLRDNASTLFQFDANGRPLTDPQTGQHAMTPYGQAFSHYLDEATQLGIAQPMARERYARQMAQSYLALQQPAQAPPETQQQKANKGNFLNRLPNRSGTLAAQRDGIPQDRQLSIGEKLKRDLIAAGHDVNGHE